MRALLCSLIGLFVSGLLRANDGSFRGKGNQLIPIIETTIAAKKEVLQIKKVWDAFAEITVDYTFDNPGEEKEITVGFEAFSPEGDADGTPRDGQHPYMFDFTVNMNGTVLPWQVAYVRDSNYVQSGKIRSLNLKTFEGNSSGSDVEFYYVYHFQARFRKGLNTIRHTYRYQLSRSVEFHYDIEYVLTAAKRWANKRIDDFTLVLDMGEFETYHIAKTFFGRATDWTLKGKGKTEDKQQEVVVHMRQGMFTFHQGNFSPKGELFVSAPLYHDLFDNLEELPFSYNQHDNLPNPKTEFEKRVYRNLPYARRGYVFMDAALKKFFEKQKWYMPDPAYVPESGKLTNWEQRWIKRWGN